MTKLCDFSILSVTYWVHLLNFSFTWLALSQAFPLPFLPLLQLRMNDRKSESFVPMMEQSQLQNPLEIRDSMENWFGKSTSHEYEDGWSVPEYATTVFPNPDKMYLPDLNDENFKSSRRHNYQTAPPYYANGSVVVINQEYFKTRDNIQPLLTEYEDEWSATEYSRPTIFSDPNEMFWPNLDDKYFKPEGSHNYRTTVPPYYANGSVVVINQEYFRMRDDIEHEWSATERATIFPDSLHLHDKYLKFERNRNHQTAAPYYANDSFIVINREYFGTQDNFRDKHKTEKKTKNIAVPSYGNSSYVRNRTSTISNESEKNKKGTLNIDDQITYRRTDYSEDGACSNLKPPDVLEREKRDLDPLNDTSDDLSWALREPFAYEAMEEILETSTLSASEEKLYRYYETKVWPTLNNFSSTLYYQVEESEEESEEKLMPRRKYTSKLKTVNVTVNCSSTPSSQLLDSGKVSESTTEAKMRSKLYRSDLSTINGSTSSQSINPSSTIALSQFEVSEKAVESTDEKQGIGSKYMPIDSLTKFPSTVSIGEEKLTKIHPMRQPKGKKHQKSSKSRSHQQAHSPKLKTTSAPNFFYDDSYEDYSDEDFMNNSTSRKVPFLKTLQYPQPDIYLTPSECTKAKNKNRPYRGRGKLSKSKKRSKYYSKRKYDNNDDDFMETMKKEFRSKNEEIY